MSLPEPVPGLVLGYAYLWRYEFLRGQEEGRKDRPCVIVLSVEDGEVGTVVTVAPITHALPGDPAVVVEVPLATKRRLGLDSERSWIVVDDLNRFVWPGFDLRTRQRGSQEYAYGVLPSALFEQVRDKVVALAKSRRIKLTRRDR